MSDDPARGFRRQLKRAPGKPSSPRARYVAAAAVAGWGVITILEAESRPIFISGFLIVAAAALAAVWTYRANRYWRR